MFRRALCYQAVASICAPTLRPPPYYSTALRSRRPSLRLHRSGCRSRHWRRALLHVWPSCQMLRRGSSRKARWKVWCCRHKGLQAAANRTKNGSWTNGYAGYHTQGCCHIITINSEGRRRRWSFHCSSFVTQLRSKAGILNRQVIFRRWGTKTYPCVVTPILKNNDLWRSNE